jgi:hypothetical protein
MNTLTVFANMTPNTNSHVECTMTYDADALRQIQLLGFKAVGFPATGLMTFTFDWRVGVAVTLAKIANAVEATVTRVATEDEVVPNVVPQISLEDRLAKWKALYG